jgi:hypothetical protein
MSINKLNNTHTGKLILAIICSLTFFGCDNKDQNSKNSLSVNQTVQKYKKETILKGAIRNKKQSFKSGEVKATDNKGKVIATTQLENNNHYSIKIPVGTELPILLSFNPENDKSEKNKLISVVLYTRMKKYDINELTTLIAKKAKSMGGYTHRNMSMAADGTVGIPDTNKTSTGFRGDPTSLYGGWH